MKKIKKGEHVVLIDDEDFERVKNRIHIVRNSSGFLSVRDRVGISIGKIILKYNGKLEVDHINRNVFDNRKINLRICTHAQNMFNRGKTKNNKSGFKGVYLDKQRTGCWMTQIKCNGKRMSKRFNTKEEAARMYNEWAKELHGEFAVLNVI